MKIIYFLLIAFISANIDYKHLFLQQILTQRKEEFISFMKTYNKNYSNLTHAQIHYRNFLLNAEKVDQLNNQQTTAKYELNENADKSSHEYSLGSGKDILVNERQIVKEMHDHNLPVSFIKVQQIPAVFDWREKGAVGPVRNQGTCESCWAQSAVQNIEAQYFLKFQKLIQFSSQQLVDCDYHDDRCRGGLFDNAFHFLMEDENLEKEIDYPYVISKNLNCLYNEQKAVLKVNNFTKIPKDEESIKQQLFQHGPLSVGVDSSPLQFYKNGIIQGKSCQGTPDHAVLLVGYGVENGQKYWIVKNSYGDGWGLGGYFHLEMGTNACKINDDVTSIEIEITNNAVI